MRRVCVILTAALLLVAAGCSANRKHIEKPLASVEPTQQASVDTIMENNQSFRLDNILKTDDLGEIHYNLSVPQDYDAAHAYALHIALPGWEGLHFQGVGEDLKWEYLPHESTGYVADMIVASLQLNDWNKNSAMQTVRLTEYLTETYSIDRDRVYITGYSAGGETLSRVLEIKPELYKAALFVSSQWDGDPSALAAARTRLYLFTSAHDSYYGSEPAKEAWQRVYDLYRAQGLTDAEISDLLVLDIREDAWFDRMMAEHAGRTGAQYATDYHGAGMLVAFDESVMQWVFQ